MELSAEQKLTNLRNKFEQFDERDLTVNDFVLIYKEIGRKLLAELDMTSSSDFTL